MGRALRALVVESTQAENRAGVECDLHNGLAPSCSGCLHVRLTCSQFTKSATATVLAAFCLRVPALRPPAPPC